MNILTLMILVVLIFNSCLDADMISELRERVEKCEGER